VRNSSAIGRGLLGAGIVFAVVVVVVVLFSGGSSYHVKARFTNASQLVKGNLVQVAGVKVGIVKQIDLSEDGEAVVDVEITDDDYAPLRKGTIATVRQASLSGVANRYIDLSLPDGRQQETIDDGAEIPSAKTTSAVDLDELFNTLDAKTRRSLQGVIKGYARAYDSNTAEANVGWLYLNPSLVSASRLFEELNRDTPLLRRFVTASSKLVTDLAERRDDLAGLVDNLATATGAIANQKTAISDAIGQLPPFMRRANTTFVNLRASLNDLTPLVNDSKPAAKALAPFVKALRPLARDARPTVRDLAGIVRRSGKDNDLVELTRSSVPLSKVAVGPVQANGKEREGALPATVRALTQAIPELTFARPYAVDLTGWFDDFTHSGLYDALGGASRAALYVNGFTNINGVLKPLLPGDRESFFAAAASLNNRNRCPLSIERGEAWKPTPDYNCDLSEVPLGP
jgi:phospholipid/cholesterol/gamma-HCH transport system substrate-binding protein